MNTRDHRTLQAIFANPVRANIVWTDVERLLRVCGAEITEDRGSH